MLPNNRRRCVGGKFEWFPRELEELGLCKHCHCKIMAYEKCNVLLHVRAESLN